MKQAVICGHGVVKKMQQNTREEQKRATGRVVSLRKREASAHVLWRKGVFLHNRGWHACSKVV